MPFDTVADPVELVQLDASDLYSLAPDELGRRQLDWARRRFEQLRDRVPFLGKLAENQQLTHIDTIDDIVPLFFQPTVFKSYPLSYLERSQFDRLTRWLDQLTVHDLSGFDAAGCDSIDSWIGELDRQTPMRIVHASATGGKLALVPRSVSESQTCEAAFYQMLQGFGAEPGHRLPAEQMPIIYLGYRHGYTAANRRLDGEIDQVAGGEDRCICLYPTRLSADVLSLAGRLKAAEDKGERGRLAISPTLLARRDEFAELHRKKDEYIAEFLNRIDRELAGQVVLGMGMWSHFWDVTLAGEQQGLSGLFAQSSPINPGSAFGKRSDIPADWYERACRFLGKTRVEATYGMTELLSYLRACPDGRYHLPPYLIAYVLDPDDSAPLPRTGVQTGRFAFLDLLAETYWGGYVSGDEVTIHWDGGCECGRAGPFLDSAIEAYTSIRAGDDKISCARVADAHDRALDFLSGAQ